jgi:3-octaprenyl-4-hydroxybenzoate carboxy-lyase
MAYSDLQDYLQRLETSGKLHWVEKQVDPSWEVSAVTRHVFDHYGWNERPALGFRRVGESPLPLVIGVIGGSPEIYALALSTTVEKIPDVWEQGQCHPIDPVSVKSGLCKEIIAHGEEVDLGMLRRWCGRQVRIPVLTSPRRSLLRKMLKPVAATSALIGCNCKVHVLSAYTSVLPSTRRGISDNMKRSSKTCR